MATTARDTSLDAALLARASNGHGAAAAMDARRRVQMEPYGAAMTMRARGCRRRQSRRLDYDVHSQSHNMRPGDPDGVNLLAAVHGDARPRDRASDPVAERISDRNALTLYGFPRQLTDHLIKDSSRSAPPHCARSVPTPTCLRPNPMDELAEAAGVIDQVPAGASQDLRSLDLIRPGEHGQLTGREGRRAARPRDRLARYKNIASYNASSPRSRSTARAASSRWRASGPQPTLGW